MSCHSYDGMEKEAPYLSRSKKDAKEGAIARRKFDIIAERNDVDQRLVALQEFVNGRQFRKLPWEQRKLLRRQERTMKVFSAILTARLRVMFNA